MFPAGLPSNSASFICRPIFDALSWLPRLLQRQFRFKNQCCFNFFMMFTMLTFYYIEQWRYYHPRSFPTLNLLLFPVQTYGINLMGYVHTTRTRPTPLLTMPPSHHRTCWRKRHLWRIWWKPISRSHTTMLPLRHLMSYLHPRSFLPEHHHRRSANRKPNPLQRRPLNVVADVTNPDPAPRVHCHSGLPKTNRNYAP